MQQFEQVYNTYNGSVVVIGKEHKKSGSLISGLAGVVGVDGGTIKVAWRGLGGSTTGGGVYSTFGGGATGCCGGGGCCCCGGGGCSGCCCDGRCSNLTASGFATGYHCE